MSKNQVYDFGGLDTLFVVCSAPTTPASGDPVLFGQIPGVALTAEDGNGYTLIATNGVFNLPVTGANSGGNAAVADGAIIYANASTGALSINSGGVRYGYAAVGSGANNVVASGATTTIPVKIGY